MEHRVSAGHNFARGRACSLTAATDQQDPKELLIGIERPPPILSRSIRSCPHR
jgi:hypothetical protein